MLFLAPAAVTALLLQPTLPLGSPARCGHPARRSEDVRCAVADRTLTPATIWRVALDLVAPGSDNPAAKTITANLRFREEDGYEPPQGFTLVESSLPDSALKTGEQSTRWMLSEDPEDRKDSLWIWGLFKEPLYPFILFELELAEDVEIVEGISIPAGKLYIQAEHRRKDGQVNLGDGTVVYKVAEQLGADLLGLSSFTYNEPIECGKIRFLTE